MISHHIASGIEIRFDQETVEVGGMFGVRKPDKAWRHFDSNGHAHLFNGEDLPTLEWVQTGVQYVGDEYDSSEIPIGEYRCRECAEVVEPRYHSSFVPEYVAGPPSYMLVINGTPYKLAPDDVGPLFAILKRCGVIK